MKGNQMVHEAVTTIKKKRSRKNLLPHAFRGTVPILNSTSEYKDEHKELE